ncbi:ribosome biogenesis protein [Candidatus Woesearchaeota archaeon]|nr:ribosome biogenesis protein [Candidatus Woesearchaeota archaeon]
MEILYCLQCGGYTLRKSCCKNTVSVLPARYSPQKYAKYRRAARIVS